MANLKYSDKHNMVAFLKKPNKSVGFAEVVDFLKGTSLRYALTHNPTIYDSPGKQFWQTATVRTLANGTSQLIASIDSTEYNITEAFVRRDFVPLLHAILAGAAMDPGEGSAHLAEPHHTPVDTLPSTSLSHIQSPSHSPHQSTPHSPHQSPPYSPTHYSPPRSYEAPLPKGNTSGSAKDSMQLKELINIVPKLVTRIETSETELQQTKTTYGKAVLTLVKRVKILEKALKRKTQKVVISASEGEAQEEDISPTILEAAKTLSKVASQGVSKVKSTDKGKEIRRERSTGSTKVDSGTASKRGQREGNAPIVWKGNPGYHKTLRANEHEEAGLEEAIKLQAQMDEEVAKQIHLDEMAKTSKKQRVDDKHVPAIEDKVAEVKEEEPKKNMKKKEAKG
ncbi:hypothetical protein Tco_1186253 [Tanacetum coccineum]